MPRPYHSLSRPTAAYWFTASTAFANPAVIIARSRMPTLAGIRPGVPGFIVAQLMGALVDANFVQWLAGSRPE